MATRMARYDIRNDGYGPYVVFYCDECSRDFRSQPDVTGTVTQAATRQAAGSILRKVPLVGALAASGPDMRYSTAMTPQQIEAAWGQVKDNFRECPTCRRIVCLSDFDVQSGFCQEDSPRKAEMAQAQAEQAAGAMRGFAEALGLGGVLRGVGQAVQTASARMARCPNDGTVAPAGTKFCAKCGSAMVQPPAEVCPKCGADVAGVAFCPQCGAKIERQPAATICANCGAEVGGAKFCPSCGAPVAQAAPPPAVCPNCGAAVAGAKFCPKCGTKVG